MPTETPAMREAKMVNVARLLLAAHILSKDLGWEEADAYIYAELVQANTEIRAHREIHGTNTDYVLTE